MTRDNTLHSVCRERNISIRELSALVDAAPSDIIFAAQGGAGSAPLRQRIAEALGARCWEDLLHGGKRTVRVKNDARLNMRCLVVLEESEATVHWKHNDKVMYEVDGVYYAQWHENGKLIRHQFFNEGDAWTAVGLF